MADLPSGLGLDVLDTVLSQAGVAVWVADDEAHGYAIRHWSPGAERIYGYPAQAALGRSYLDLIVAERDWDRAAADHRRLLAGDSPPIKWTSIATDLDVDGLPVQVFFASFRRWWDAYGRYLLVEVAIRVPEEATVGDAADVSAEQVLVVSENQLGRMVGRAVTDTYRRIVPLLLHRLANPVDAIRFESSQLTDPAGERMAPGPLKRVDRIAENIDRIDRLLEELDRLSDGVPPRTSLNLHQVVESTRLATVTAEFRYVEVHNQVDTALEWTTHELILREVLSTLIVNACEAVTREHGGGDIAVSAKVDTYGHLVVDIDDTGPGFPREAFHHDRRRVSSKGKRHGRGLLYAERALEIVGGRLDLSRQRGPLGGARVTIVLET